MLSLQRIVRPYLCRLSKASCVNRQIRLPFCTLKKMTSARKPTNPSGFTSSQSHGTTTDMLPPFNNEEEYPSLTVNKGSSSKGPNSHKRRTEIEPGLKQKLETVESSHLRKKKVKSVYVQKYPSDQSKSKDVVGTSNSDCSEGDKNSSGIESGTVNSSELDNVNFNIASLLEENSLPIHFGKKVGTSFVSKTPGGQRKSNNLGARGTKNSGSSEGSRKVERFNICLPTNRVLEQQEILRPGMVLLKRYISLREQINIVKTCQTLGEGPGGFYRPGYKDGAKLSLHMMCLGLNWDAQTRKYDRRHPIDDCEPPDIPLEFRVLVQRAIQDAQFLIEKDSHLSNPEDVLPSITPNICIVNFYTKFGKLGLHQDRDESIESLQKGLPVVSLSIGDSAKFLYGDQRDAEQADEMLLESGDVLLFGGESRMVFHGVRSIIPFSAPKALVAETGLRCPGRLNLTFREF